MFKIYPSPFNKFAVFILYGLFSVAVITLAQPGQGSFPTQQCPITSFPQILNGKIIGYVHQLDSIDINTIKWSYYDYINVIAYPKYLSPPWNDFRPPDNPEILDPLKGFVAKANGNNTKVLLSIRNYDISKFPSDDDSYSEIVRQTLKTINDTKVDGLDIEYPGMRGIACVRDGQPIWNTAKDGNFVDFIEELHNGLKPLNKTLMLTVGSDVIIGLNDSHIDYLNIETYHFSLYENIRLSLGGASTRTFPNAPYNKYEEAYGKWTVAGINGTQITMGIDLGNTLQIVDNPAIQTELTIDSARYPPQPQQDQRAIDLCPGNSDLLFLSTFPWSQLADSLNYSSGDCYRFDGWDYHFDSATFTPWLTKNIGQQVPQISPGEPNQNNPGEAKQSFQFISFEDRVSLSKKLSFAASKSVGGISISDISYDDEQVSLINYIQSVRQPKPIGTGLGSGKEPPPPGVIAGAVVGSILGLVFISGILFLGYRYKDRLPFGQNKYNKETMYNYPGTHMNQPGMIPDGSPRMIIPDTTAIPVAPSYVTAMFDFAGKEENDLSFKKGDKIEVLERGDGPNDWWVGKVNGAVGEFPGNYVKE